LVDDRSDAAHPGNPLGDLPTILPADVVVERAGGYALPRTIGRYRIIRVLGEGGMGTVFEAEQDQPRRRVALKVIRTSWANPQTLLRFQQESQALGWLHHPGIAQIFEAGSAETPSGRLPFFAMELIQGLPLTQYADQHHLDIRRRLALMVQVCDAVQHAHQRGIIHRDLKPGNILVDEAGQPKILDFGLARITESDAEVTRQTDVGQVLGTLAYMSPEQVLADPTALDTRSDVYALGVILYELLANKLPYTLSRQLHEATRTIQETDPSPLSSINRAFRGDVDTIVAKALEKDKTRRYQSAADLAGDIRRYLDDLPITAKPASASYQLRKFARRHKAIVSGVAAVFVVLIAGVIVSTWEAVRARKARIEAERQSEIARAVNDFLQKDLLAQASAYNQSKPDPNMKVRTALDRAAQNIAGKFNQQPAVESAIRETVGTTYTDLGLYAEGRKQLERAVELDKQVWGPKNPKTIETMLHLAETEELGGQYTDAEALAKQALDLSRRVLGPESMLTLKIMNRITSICDELGTYPEGEALGTQAVEISERVNGPEAVETLDSMYFLAIMYYEEGKYAQAEDLDAKVLEARRRLLGPDHPDTLNATNNLAAAYASDKKYPESIALDKQLIEARTRVLGADHPDTLDAMVNLAFDYRGEKKPAEAESIDRQILEIQKRVLGPEHPNTLRSMHNLANDVRAQGHLAEAQAIDRQTLEIRQRVLGPDNPDTLWSMSNLAYDYNRGHHYAEAAALDSKTAELRARVLGPDHPLTVQSLSELAAEDEVLGNYAQAESVIRKLCAAQPKSPARLNQLAWFLLTVPDEQLRRPAEALELSQKSVELAGPDAGDEYNTLGLALVRNKRWDEAVEILKKSIEVNESSEPTDFFFLAMAYQGRGAKSDAERSFASGVELARKLHRQDPDTTELWAEAARIVGRPGPRTTPAH